MNTATSLAFALIALALSGCASPTPPAYNQEPYVKPGLVMLTADQAARRGIAVTANAPAEPPLPRDLQALDAAAVTVPPGVKVYTLNRAVDPADRDLLHEEHVVYRRETPPRWRLDAPAEQKILVGPRVTDGRQDLQPLLAKELTTFLADERRLTEANQKAIAALFEAVDALSRQQQAMARRELEKSGDSMADRPGHEETTGERSRDEQK